MDDLIRPRKRQNEPNYYNGDSEPKRSKKASRALLAGSTTLSKMSDQSKEFDNLFKGKDTQLNVTYEPVPLTEVSGGMCLKHDPDCFGCAWGFGKPNNPAKYPQMARLFFCYADNLGKISNIELYYRVVENQKKLFVDPYTFITDPVVRAKLPKVWTFEKAKEHFESHAVYMDVEFEHDFIRLRGYVNMLEKHVNKKEVGTDKIIPDLEVGKHYLLAMEKKQNTMKLILAERRR